MPTTDKPMRVEIKSTRMKDGLYEHFAGRWDGKRLRCEDAPAPVRRTIQVSLKAGDMHGTFNDEDKKITWTLHQH